MAAWVSHWMNGWVSGPNVNLDASVTLTATGAAGLVRKMATAGAAATAVSSVAAVAPIRVIRAAVTTAVSSAGAVRLGIPVSGAPAAAIAASGIMRTGLRLQGTAPLTVSASVAPSADIIDLNASVLMTVAFDALLDLVFPLSGSATVSAFAVAQAQIAPPIFIHQLGQFR